MKDTDLAWAAGFLDGEGCFSMDAQNGGSSWRVFVTASNTNILVLEKLRALFGGRIHFHAHNNPRAKPYGRWYLANRPAVEAAKMLLPYLVNKTAVASLVIEYYESTPHNRSNRAVSDGEILRRYTFKERLTVLNKRGTA